MENSKNELVEKLIDKAKVLCAWVGYKESYDGEKKYENLYELKTNHTEKEFTDFLNDLDFNYDDGYGGQELFGYIWLEDGTWLERGEYDGSEWWSYKHCLKIPKELQS